jgi:hypothetical protein
MDESGEVPQVVNTPGVEQGRRGVGVDLSLVAGRVVAVVLALEDVETDGLAAGRPLRFSGAGDPKARGGKWPDGDVFVNRKEVHPPP